MPSQPLKAFEPPAEPPAPRHPPLPPRGAGQALPLEPVGNVLSKEAITKCVEGLESQLEVASALICGVSRGVEATSCAAKDAADAVLGLVGAFLATVEVVLKTNRQKIVLPRPADGSFVMPPDAAVYMMPRVLRILNAFLNAGLLVPSAPAALYQVRPPPPLVSDAARLAFR